VVGGLAVLALLAGCKRETLRHVEPAAPAPTPVQRTKVLNGDVIVLDGRSLRLANAFAPQPIPYARCWSEAIAARAVTKVLRGKISEAQQIAARTTPERDEFNRTVAYVTLDGLDVGDTLYAEGLAARRTAKPFRWCDGFSASVDGAPAVNSLLGPGP
jgi:endonuclease YncB( thermonuclease family)